MADSNTTLFDRWLRDSFRPQVQLAWEVLPDSQGQAHAVDPDPDAQSDEWPVSLCGKVLVAKEGAFGLSEMCSVCLELSRERQAEFDSRAGVTTDGEAAQ